VVLHRAKDMPDGLAGLLQARTELRVIEVEDKDVIEPGMVFIAPADYHLLVDRGCFSLSIEPPVNYARPSIDVLFESAVDVFGSKTIGVVLTGASKDGASGAALILKKGGKVLVQQPLSAESRVLPEAALMLSPRARVEPLPNIATVLVEWSRTE
jgi:two-component system chemotaxis response regulator CheB